MQNQSLCFLYFLLRARKRDTRWNQLRDKISWHRQHVSLFKYQVLHIRPRDGHLPWFDGSARFGQSGPETLCGHPGFHTLPPPAGANSEEEAGREARGADSDGAPTGGGGV